MQEFGQITIEILRLQIECARIIKAIQFCQMYLNKGMIPDTDTLRQAVQKETRKLADHLQALKRSFDIAQNATEISGADLKAIRALYRKIAKRIHPDIHPELQDISELPDLWQQVNDAYMCNDLDLLSELDLLISITLSGLHGQMSTTQVHNIKEKIQKLESEIREIQSSDSYHYKALLSDSDRIKEKHLELQQQADAYWRYSAELHEKLTSILPENFILFSDNEWWRQE